METSRHKQKGNHHRVYTPNHVASHGKIITINMMILYRTSVHLYKEIGWTDFSYNTTNEKKNTKLDSEWERIREGNRYYTQHTYIYMYCIFYWNAASVSRKYMNWEKWDSEKKTHKNHTNEKEKQQTSAMNSKKRKKWKKELFIYSKNYCIKHRQGSSSSSRSTNTF